MSTEQDHPADGDDGPSPDGSPFPPGEGPAGADDDGTPPSDPSGDENDEHVDNPAAQKASRDAARYRTQLREAEARIKQLENAAGDDTLADENRLLRIRLEFERQGKTITDPDAAWRLVQDDLAAVDLDDDGQPDADRVGEIVAHVQQRYPYLCDAPAATQQGPPPDPRTGRPTSASGATGNGKRVPEDKAVDKKAMQAKYPAFRHR